MSATDEIDTGVSLARIAQVAVVGTGRLRLRWADGPRIGLDEVVDLTPVIGSYRVYRPLRTDAARFATLRLVDDGHALAWDGVEAEMSAELVARCAEEGMSPGDFAAFLKRNRLTQDAAAALLGRSRRQIATYLKEGPIPRVVALACHGYEALATRSAETAA